MPGKRAKILSAADVGDLVVFASCTRQPLRNTVMVLLSAKAGLRAGEIANLTWDMVVDANDQISGLIELADTAAKKCSGRSIPIHPDLAAALMAWRQVAPPSIYLITSERGGRMRPLSIVVWSGRDGFWLARWLRTRSIEAQVIHASSVWSQYFCCLVTGSREFVRTYPVATKRALRGILKAADQCATAPDTVARSLVDRRFTPRYDYALQVMKELPYGKWREYDPEDTIRFYALRLREAGMIKSNPNKIIAQGTDWRFFNELKRELKS
jgi:hypothetical protein